MTVDLRKIYPRFEENSEYYKNRIKSVICGFKNNFDGAPRIFSAPGRTEIGGNHTDHQNGCVLCASIDLDIVGAISKNNSNMVNIVSEGYSPISVDISNLEVDRNEFNTSSSLVRGIVARIKELGYDVSGFNMYCISSVLNGSGLSSSAAYEVLIGTAINGVFCEGNLAPIDIAQIGHYAENVYFGKPSGLMDQTASSVGGITALDFAIKSKPKVTPIDFNFATSKHKLVIIDSGADHANLTDEYTAISVEMREVAKYFGKELLNEVSKEMLFADIAEVRKHVGDRAVLRALHFVEDTERSKREAEFLMNGNFEGFLKEVTESGLTSLMYLQNISPAGSVKHQEVAFTLAMCREFLGGRGAYRVHGGGFAGTVQAFLPNEMVEEFCENMEKAMAAKCCHVLSIRPIGGVELEVI